MGPGPCLCSSYRLWLEHGPGAHATDACQSKTVEVLAIALVFDLRRFLDVFLDAFDTLLEFGDSLP